MAYDHEQDNRGRGDPPKKECQALRRASLPLQFDLESVTAKPPAGKD
jgi:hypothetical protein